MSRRLALAAYARGADAVLVRDGATPELAARLMGRAGSRARQRRGTARSVADAALALCGATTAAGTTAGATHAGRAGRRPVVLLDVDLPGLDGFRILHELGSARPGSYRVILCTVHSSEATHVPGIQSGALDPLTKPLRIVLAKVERLLGRGSRSAAVGG